MVATPKHAPPRRGLLQIEAATYIGVGIDKFRDLVQRGLMPPPKRIDDRRVWDIEQLDLYFAALPEDTRAAGERAPARRLSPHSWDDPPKPA